MRVCVCVCFLACVYSCVYLDMHTQAAAAAAAAEAPPSSEPESNSTTIDRSVLRDVEAAMKTAEFQELGGSSSSSNLINKQLALPLKFASSASSQVRSNQNASSRSEQDGEYSEAEYEDEEEDSLTKKDSEELDPMSDGEASQYMFSPEEVANRQQLWEELNKDYLEAQKFKEQSAAANPPKVGVARRVCMYVWVCSVNKIRGTC
jgi:Brf1-like TBP-binding domain